MKVTASIIKEAQQAEIKVTVLHQLRKNGCEENKAYKLYNKWLLGQTITEICNIGLTISFYMDWQKRWIGNRYHSISGHGIMIGCATKKFIGIIVYVMKCTKCHAAHKKNTPVEEHDSSFNYVDSSKAMESTAALEMSTAIYNEHNGIIYIMVIISDDDSIMMAKVSHESKNIHGELSIHIPQPNFKADPGHRIKSMCKPVF